MHNALVHIEILEYLDHLLYSLEIISGQLHGNYMFNRQLTVNGEPTCATGALHSRHSGQRKFLMPFYMVFNGVRLEPFNGVPTL